MLDLRRLGLLNPRQGLTVRFEVGAGVGNQFLVCRVIDRFDARNMLDEPGLVAMDVFDEFGLGNGRARDQDRMYVCQRCGYGVQVILVLGRMAGADAIRLMMQMLGWIVRMQHELIDAVAIEMKDAGFAMIDPDDGVAVAGHAVNPC